MNWKRKSKALLLVIVATSILFTSPTLANLVTFQREYTYQASEADSKLSCRVIALEQVKRLLLEELGTYLEAETEVKDYQLTKDQITTLTAGIVRTEIVDEKWDGRVYWLKAKIAADPDKVAQSLGALRKDRQKRKELEEVRNKAEQASREIERLKKEIDSLQGELDTKRLRQYNQAINDLSAADWFCNANAFYESNNNEEAIKAYTRSIKLDPNFMAPYYNRGMTYNKKGQYDLAIEDFNKALELNPNLASAYHNRWLAYSDKGQDDLAIADFSKALELDPNYVAAYNNRGLAHKSKGQYDLAIADFNKALELDPNDASSYNFRGFAYLLKGQYNLAIANYNKALELDPNNADAYYYRGITYKMNGQYKMAVEDHTRALELGWQQQELE